jgi:glycosyltransferase involved in cell wall biosynthesis
MNRRLRVCIVTTTYPRHEEDSVPRFVADLADRLVSDHQIDVHVIAPHEGGLARRDLLRGVPVERFVYALNPERQCLAYGGGIPDNLRRFRRAKLQVPAFCASMGWAVFKAARTSDVIHAQWVEPALIASVANALHRKPLVLTVHSLPPKLNGLHRRVFRRADRVIFNSHFMMKLAMNRGVQCRAEVVYQGYDNGSFGVTAPTGSMRARLGIPSTATLISTVGRMIQRKGMHVLVEAAPAIMATRPNVHLALAGDGPCLTDVAALAAASPFRERIHLPGALSREKVAQLLADSDLFVNPAMVDDAGLTEPLGIVSMEAMASGLSCVGSRVGGLPETIEDGVTGLLVEPAKADALAEAVGRLLDDPDLRARMGQAGRRRASEHFTWPAQATRVAEIYQEVLEASRGGAKQPPSPSNRPLGSH